MGKKNFYAVSVGTEPGIYLTWDECKAQTSGFLGAKFKGFATQGATVEYMRQAGAIQHSPICDQRSPEEPSSCLKRKLIEPEARAPLPRGFHYSSSKILEAPLCSLGEKTPAWGVFPNGQHQDRFTNSSAMASHYTSAGTVLVQGKNVAAVNLLL